MALSPMYQGCTSPPWKPSLIDDSGNPIPLYGFSGSNFSLKMVNKANGHVKNCTGPWTIVDYANGIVTYQWQPFDVDTVGTWLLYVFLQRPEGELPFDFEPLQVLAAPPAP